MEGRVRGVGWCGVAVAAERVVKGATSQKFDFTFPHSWAGRLAYTGFWSMVTMPLAGLVLPRISQIYLNFSFRYSMFPIFLFIEVFHTMSIL